MDFGLILPSYREGASVEGIDAATEVAEHLGWHSVLTTDHLLVGLARAAATTSRSSTPSSRCPHRRALA